MAYFLSMFRIRVRSNFWSSGRGRGFLKLGLDQPTYPIRKDLLLTDGLDVDVAFRRRRIPDKGMIQHGGVVNIGISVRTCNSEPCKRYLLSSFTLTLKYTDAQTHSVIPLDTAFCPLTESPVG